MLVTVSVKVNPTRSKTRQDTFEGCSPEYLGRLLEACGNVRRRWMTAPVL